jgi:hypothetical protein
MTLIYFITQILLIFLCLAGLFGLFFFQEYIRKISSLSVAYSSFVILFTLLALKSVLLNELLVIMVSIFTVFSINLLIGIGLANKIAEAKNLKNGIENK